MKQNIRVILFGLLAMLVAMPSVTACAANDTSGKQGKAGKPVTGVKPINIPILKTLIIQTRSCGRLRFVN